MKLGARFYDPEVGRFISQDSYLGESGTPPSLHRYLYAYGNPTVYWDPTGHAPVISDIKEFFDSGSEYLTSKIAEMEEERKRSDYGFWEGSGQTVKGGVLGLGRIATDLGSFASNNLDRYADATLGYHPLYSWTETGKDSKQRIHDDAATVKMTAENIKGFAENVYDDPKGKGKELSVKAYAGAKNYGHKVFIEGDLNYSSGFIADSATSVLEKEKGSSRLLTLVRFARKFWWNSIQKFTRPIAVLTGAVRRASRRSLFARCAVSGRAPCVRPAWA